MIVVSYTRMVPCAGTEGADAVRLQNTRIAEYAKARGWKLSKKYSDRKEDAGADDAFQKMRKDGIDRKFDCLVIDSMYSCGKEVHFAADLFQFVFVAAGISFAVVEDGFFSGEHTETEISDYIAGKRLEYKKKVRCTVQYEKLAKREYAKYGYCYKNDGAELEEDPVAADVVRMIFHQTAEGKLPAEICEELNEKGIEQPTYYWKQKYGKPLSGCRKEWVKGKIGYLIHNRIYLGEWKRKLYGEETMCSCPALVDEKTFQKVQEITRARFQKGEQKNFNGQAFSNQISDKDTGLSLRVYTHTGLHESVFRFGYPKPEKIFYEKTYIKYDIVEGEVIRQIQAEHRKAAAVLKALNAGKGDAVREKLCREYKRMLQEGFQKQMNLESRRFEKNRRALKNISGDGTEQTDKEILAEIKRLDGEIRENMEKLKEAEQTISPDNPWVKLYASDVPTRRLERSDVKKWTDGILVEKFERVEAMLKHKEYVSCFPPEWFKEET